MWKMAIAIIGVLSGCSDDDCGSAHVVFRGTDLPAPAEAPHGTLFGASRGGGEFTRITALPDGNVACTTCTGFALLDRTLAVTNRSGESASEIAATDDTIYVVQSDSGFDDLHTGELAAYERDGTRRWTVSLADPLQVRLSATPEGVYLRRGNVLTQYAAATGAGQPVTAPGLVTAGTGGVFTHTATDDALTVRRRDRAGALQWEHTWPTTARARIRDSAASADGCLVLAIDGTFSLDLGDRVVTGGSIYPILVALAPEGAVRWAFQINDDGARYPLRVPPQHLAITATGDALLAGDTGPLSPVDGYLAYASAGAVQAVYPVAGDADQIITDVAAGADGLAWLSVLNFHPERNNNSLLTFAGREYRDTGLYVFAIAP